MKEITLNKIAYKLPDSLTKFQEQLYVHLIDWKWKNITKKVGYHNYKGKKIPYDAILPDSVMDDYPIIYPPILSAFKIHHRKFPFRIHKFFNHMASSQAANANLFLPILIHEKANDILRKLLPGFKSLATSELDNGFQIEFWGAASGKGLLGDHTEQSGTDSDIAIAYINTDDEPCVWLIEHKLTEKEFTECGGAKSPNKTSRHNCSSSMNTIIKNNNLCYYHDVKKFDYWNITEKNISFFKNREDNGECPFRGGLNQLWRNQLLALSIENGKLPPYKHASFSVVHHPQNTSLDESMGKFERLIGNNTMFSHFTSNKVLDAAGALNDPILNQWITWYRELYNIEI